MCPLYPVRLVLMYGTGLVCVWFMGLGSVVNAATEAATLKVRLYVNNSSVTYLDVKEGGEKQVTFHLDDLPPNTVGDILILDENEDNLDHLGIEPDRIPLPPAHSDEAGTRSFTIIGKFLGFTKIKFMINTIHDQNLVSEPVEVRVQRGERVLDKIFIHVVIGLVVLAYINMGCAIELKVIKQTLLRPVAPVIGLLSQYLFMPLVAVAGMLLPWLGFVFGGLASVLCRRSLEESIAISIETGVQQTGLSIGILKVALRKYAPLGDVTMVIPVAVATMTPIPLTIAYIIKRIRDCRRQHNTYEIDEENVRENAEISLSSTAAIQNDSNNCNNSAKK